MESFRCQPVLWKQALSVQSVYFRATEPGGEVCLMLLELFLVLLPSEADCGYQVPEPALNDSFFDWLNEFVDDLIFDHRFQ